jgi:hypothetical protein
MRFRSQLARLDSNQQRALRPTSTPSPGPCPGCTSRFIGTTFQAGGYLSVMSTSTEELLASGNEALKVDDWTCARYAFEAVIEQDGGRGVAFVIQ